MKDARIFIKCLQANLKIPLLFDACEKAHLLAFE
jgi:hypothetical protein